MFCLLQKRQVNGYSKNEKHLVSNSLWAHVFVSMYTENCRMQLARYFNVSLKENLLKHFLFIVIFPIRKISYKHILVKYKIAIPEEL